MTIDAQRLVSMMWLASPALPVGAFSYSEGLEAAVDAGFVADETSAASWLSDHLELVLVRSELPAIAHAMQAWRRGDMEDVLAVDEWVLRTRESAEQRAQTLQMGHSLVAWLRNGDHRLDERLDGAHQRPLTWPVAYALAAEVARLTPHDALLTSAFGWSENMVQAAMKAVPLGQLAGQRILSRLAREIPDAVERALRVGDDERRAFAPMLAVLGACHETQYTRIFRS
jgi:urease accessory protein